MADGPDRQTALKLDLDGEQVNLIRLMSSEALSQPFSFVLDMLAPLEEIDFLKHLGKPAAVEVLEDGQHQRFFHGILVGAEFLDHTEHRGSRYRVMLKPAAFLHAQGSNYRIFQPPKYKDTLEIITAVLAECDIKANFDGVTEPTSTRAYCVQYGESNFGFVARLMEEEGLYYYYRHDRNGHVLTVCDAPSAHKEGTASPLIYNDKSRSVAMVNSRQRSRSAQGQYVHSWHERISSGGEQKVTLRDYDFMSPDTLDGTATDDTKYHLPAVEVFRYPARSWDTGVVQKRSEILLDARRAARLTYSGESANAAISCGWTFELTKAKFERQNGSYLLTQVQHSIAPEQYSSDFGYAGGTNVDFEAVPAATRWRAPLTTPRPVVLGPETAVVTGPPGEEIYTDEYGRIKVQFHWDREGGLDDKSSCWMRVTQALGLGSVGLPRIGWEVLVHFIDGDPDRPIVVGTVFNEGQKPHYDLPGNKTRAVWRSGSYKQITASGAKKDVAADDPKGGCPGTNEIRLEDATGAEEFYMFAQRDFKTLIRRDETHHLGNDLDIDVGQNRKLTIGVDDTVKVKNDRKTEIDNIEKRKVGTERSTNVGTNETLKVGQKIVIDAGTEIEITAKMKITLKVGGSTITMTPTGIEVKAPMTLNTEAGLMAEHKGPGGKVQINPVGVTINGILVMIN